MRSFRFIFDLTEEPALNLTSLIDVVFIILITFIVIAPLLDVDRVALAPGGKNDTAGLLGESSAVMLQVRRDDSIFLNGKLTSSADLRVQLEALHRAQPFAKPQLFHDREARFGTYQAVRQAVEEAGFDELDVMLEPQS
jgi:biopolymer transport protein ExbD